MGLPDTYPARSLATGSKKGRMKRPFFLPGIAMPEKPL
jgi:hypothetical protein